MRATSDSLARAVLTRDEIRALASDLGLGVVVEVLIDALVPAYRLEPSPDGAHRIGGEPDLVAGETWPRSERGTALTFIAQLDVGRIPPLPPLTRAFRPAVRAHGGELGHPGEGCLERGPFM